MGCHLCKEEDKVVFSIENDTELKTETNLKVNFKDQLKKCQTGLQRKAKSFIQKNFYENMNMIPRNTECYLESELKEVYSVRENSICGQLNTAAIFFLIDSSLLKDDKILIQNSIMAIFFDFKRYFTNTCGDTACKTVFYKVIYDNKKIFNPTRYQEYSSFNAYLKIEESIEKNDLKEGGTLNAINEVCEIYETNEKDAYESVFIFHYHNSLNDDELGEVDLNLRNIDSLKYELILFGDGERFLENLDQNINYDLVKVISKQD